MRIQIGNIFEHMDELDYVGITTNSTLNNKGHLVMGAGNAKQAKEICPELPKIFGEQIRKGCGNLGFYGLLKHDKYFALQTKLHWRDKSPIKVVSMSICKLNLAANKHPDKIFGTPFPAINHGKLKECDVLPMLSSLPDNVIVFKLEE